MPSPRVVSLTRALVAAGVLLVRHGGMAGDRVPAATIAAQGGNAAGCGSFTSSNVDGWVLQVTVVPINVGGPDFLTIQHDGSPTPPTSASMN